jgi:hypothetical protein
MFSNNFWVGFLLSASAQLSDFMPKGKRALGQRVRAFERR